MALAGAVQEHDACQAAGLKHQIELATGLPGEKLKLVHKGKTIHQEHVALSDSGKHSTAALAVEQ